MALEAAGMMMATERPSGMIRTREQVQAILTKAHVAWITKVHTEGLADDESYDPGLRRKHHPILRAGIRNCHIVDRARLAAEEMPDIRVCIRRGRLLFIIGEQLCVSFKKLDRRLRSRNIPTRQARGFTAQQPRLLSLPPELTNLIAGYQLDGSETKFELWVTCPDGGQHVWEWPIAGFGVLEITPMPAATEETGRKRASRVNVRDGVERKRDADEAVG